ncbi:hypothetical protein N7481_001330 [Penicillium waksmanii]|uniref:uncharacterized protein n=1 Tax=Penicillium waksmanii TaxID=69791 RepID=UPI0025489BAD|nr:uncharacterized protein N7481_001330 [Penicillium waksmanii]KAJ6000921.1 hypothetical protein N7481_001330 [Penicillium waksmanii]
MSEKAGECDNDLFEVLSGYGDLDIEETVDDSTSTEGDMSETSEDRRFVASESDDATYSDEESLGSSFPCIHHLMDGQETSSTVGKKIPISSIASRLISEDGISVVQYLVLWQSWEREMPHEADIELNTQIESA